MEYLAYFILGFLALRVMISSYNLISRQWLKKSDPLDKPLISILIPARNEEKNIGSLVKSLLDQDYKNIEILVFDDQSEDKTAGIVMNLEKSSGGKVRLISSEGLPQGWLGKNHACHKLAGVAAGEYFLFIDADVILKKGLIKDALGHVSKNHLALFSIFPQQIMKTFGERISVPIMNWVLVSLLPLSLIRNSRKPAFSAANGQFMMFKARVYRKELPHERFRDHKVEDIAIMKFMKKRSYKVDTMLSGGQIQCRMYEGFMDAVNGFSKNVIEFFGGSVFLLVVYALITGFGGFVIYFFTPLFVLYLFILLTILHRMIVSILSRQSIIYNILFVPFQLFAFVVITTKALIVRFSGRYVWKDRIILSEP
jgi:cellulose synthase/poly-beta-1,6-N-acetylglucosamine synthase-like glycosyltransferase